MADEDVREWKPPSFKEACEFVSPFGKYKGETIARIGSNDEGLRYLRWIMTAGPFNKRFEAHLKVFLANQAVAIRVREAIQEA